MTKFVKLQSEYPDLDKYKNYNEDIYYCKKDTNIMHNPYGPAIVFKSGRIEYYIEDKLHRLDGPAKIYADGDIAYYIDGDIEGFSKQEFYNKIKKLKTKNINNQHKKNILNIKNSLSHNLDPHSFNILKSLL